MGRVAKTCSASSAALDLATTVLDSIREAAPARAHPAHL